MRIGKISLMVMALAFTPMFMSCQDNSGKKDHSEGHEEAKDGHDHEHTKGMSHGDNDMMAGSGDIENPDQIIDNYLSLKNALVADDKEKAAQAGGNLMDALKNFNISKYEAAEQEELKEIIVDATEQAEHISRSPIDHQREHFDMLSVDLIDMLAITGTSKTLFQAYCPMYNDNKGAKWLSASEEIRNPYFGSSMLSCGTVQKQIGK